MTRTYLRTTNPMGEFRRIALRLRHQWFRWPFDFIRPGEFFWGVFVFTMVMLAAFTLPLLRGVFSDDLPMHPYRSECGNSGCDGRGDALPGMRP